MRTITEIIAAKRDGLRLSDDEIRHVIADYARGRLPEEQMAALAMAIWFKGLDDHESGVWTDAMLRSGTILDLADVGDVRVDKHSTGGVGDKVSLILAPAAAACGLTVPMVSGRGLGHTGGTIDKLEAIAGFSTDLPIARFRAILADVGCAIVGATDDIAPADKRLYALRGVTATVSSLPLIVSSIMSKKLAEGIDGLVLDVKVGQAAFMKTLDDARALARGMIAVGERMGVRVVAFITRMDEPLGRMVGNACEVVESIELLEGRGPDELEQLIVTLTGAMLEIGLGVDVAEGQRRARAALQDGSARARFARMVTAQGGDLAAIARPTGETPILAPRDGYVAAIDGLEIGLTCVGLGAGRRVSSDPIDPAVGVRVDASRGAAVRAGEPLCTVFHGAAGPPAAAAVGRLARAFTLSDTPCPAAPLVVERLG